MEGLCKIFKSYHIKRNDINLTEKVRSFLITVLLKEREDFGLLNPMKKQESINKIQSLPHHGLIQRARNLGLRRPLRIAIGAIGLFGLRPLHSVYSPHKTCKGQGSGFNSRSTCYRRFDASTTPQPATAMKPSQRSLRRHKTKG
jgi:hypothetical protein